MDEKEFIEVYNSYIAKVRAMSNDELKTEIHKLENIIGEAKARILAIDDFTGNKE